MVLWLKYEPQELVDTSNLSSEEWLSYRRRGIGGSDAAAILGISPWRTARDLYYDKLSVVKADMDENWVALEMGHLLENLVARIFAKKTGLRIFQRKVMFQHPLYPWMLADLDYLAELPDGSNAILEIKTTNYNARENWWYNGEEIVPVYYESQGRHYMSVMNLDRVYFCCLYGNNEDEVIIRHLDRDYAYSLLTNDCASALEAVGLDSYVGFLHRDRPGRTSLALDLMEELRPCFADRFVLTMINNRVMQPSDFEQAEDGAVRMTDDARRKFLKNWQERKQETITHPYLGEKMPWGLVPYMQALLLSRFLRGDLDAYPPFLWK